MKGISPQTRHYAGVAHEGVCLLEMQGVDNTVLFCDPLEFNIEAAYILTNMCEASM